MGIFDSVVGKVKCPNAQEESDVEVQFKWGDPSMRRYSVGEQLAIGPYGNIWIQENYTCRNCSEYEQAEVGRRLKKPVEHEILLHLDNGSILELITKEEFDTRFVKDGKIDLPAGQKVIDRKSEILY